MTGPYRARTGSVFPPDDSGRARRDDCSAMTASFTSSLRNVVIALAVALFSVAAGVGPMSTRSQAAADSDPIESSSPVDLRAAALRQDVWRINLTLNTQGTKQPMPVGCSVPGPSVRYHGPRGRPFVGITFDDGPGAYTTRVLRILRRFEVSATFFQIGSQVRGANRIERKILRSGSEIGDHSYGHETNPGYGSIAAGSRAILRASGFRPCVFRPPGGRASSEVVAAARANGMKTVLWDVDPRDWSNPGTGAIIANVLAHAHRGAIIIMHDGGSRSQTLAALPTILRGLRSRGLRAVKVSRLLKGSTRWG